jgi:hypothetical protein
VQKGHDGIIPKRGVYGRSGRDVAASRRPVEEETTKKIIVECVYPSLGILFCNTFQTCNITEL